MQTGQASQDGRACVPTAFKSFSLAQKEKTLNELIQDQWLSSSSDGNIGLGVRSFLDLRGWFRNNDFPSCDVCNEAGIKVCSFYSFDFAVNATKLTDVSFPSKFP